MLRDARFNPDRREILSGKTFQGRPINENEFRTFKKFSMSKLKQKETFGIHKNTKKVVLGLEPRFSESKSDVLTTRLHNQLIRPINGDFEIIAYKPPIRSSRRLRWCLCFPRSRIARYRTNACDVDPLDIEIQCQVS